MSVRSTAPWRYQARCPHGWLFRAHHLESGLSSGFPFVRLTQTKEKQAITRLTRQAYYNSVA